MPIFSVAPPSANTLNWLLADAARRQRLRFSHSLPCWGRAPSADRVRTCRTLPLTSLRPVEIGRREVIVVDAGQFDDHVGHIVPVDIDIKPVGGVDEIGFRVRVSRSECR